MLGGRMLESNGMLRGKPGGGMAVMRPSRGRAKSARMLEHGIHDHSIKRCTPEGKWILCHMPGPGSSKSEISWIFKIFKLGEHEMQRANNGELRELLIVMCVRFVPTTFGQAPTPATFNALSFGNSKPNK